MIGRKEICERKGKREQDESEKRVDQKVIEDHIRMSDYIS